MIAISSPSLYTADSSMLWKVLHGSSGSYFFPSLHRLTGSKLIIVHRVLLTFMLLFVLIRGIIGARRGEGVAAPMVEV